MTNEAAFVFAVIAVAGLLVIGVSPYSLAVALLIAVSAAYSAPMVTL